MIWSSPGRWYGGATRMLPFNDGHVTTRAAGEELVTDRTPGTVTLPVPPSSVSFEAPRPSCCTLLPHWICCPLSGIGSTTLPACHRMACWPPSVNAAQMRTQFGPGVSVVDSYCTTRNCPGCEVAAEPVGSTYHKDP